MKLHHCVSLPLVVAWGLLASISWGDISPLPGTVKSSTSPPMDQIQTFINGAIDQLKDNNNPQGQSAARDALVNAVSGQTSGIFQDLYALALNAALKAQIATDPNMRVRLNGAIVAAKVAEKVNNARLADVVVVFLNDNNEAVVLWGIKAARFIIPAVLQGAGGNTAIIKALPAVLKSHPNSAVIQEAYQAFDPPRASAPAVFTVAVGQVLPMLATRIEQYKSALPEDPSAEVVPVVFLSAPRVWQTPGVLTAATKVQIVQELSDLLGLLGQRAQNANGQELVKIIPVVTTIGKALFVIGGNTQNAELQAAVSPLTKLSYTVTGAEVYKLTQPVAAAIMNSPMFKTVKPPPQLAPAAEAAATEPSTTK
jgi:hypothetical protein